MSSKIVFASNKLDVALTCHIGINTDLQRIQGAVFLLQMDGHALAFEKELKTGEPGAQ